jgi:TPR repeat protein
VKHEEIVKKAERGSASCQMMLGECYLIGKNFDGDAIPIDYLKARKWLELADAKGVSTASFLLGTIYEEGLGVDTNVAMAVELYEKAAKTKNICALHNLARIHAQGKGLPRNLEAARFWYAQILTIEDKGQPPAHQAEFASIIEEARQYLKRQNG